MYINKISKMILIFFIYSLIGWIWESTFKSIRQKKFINRGFLNGPWLPIYGFGALIIITVTFQFRRNNILIFLLGMVTASLFEFLVGYMMEKLFHARYWDYSHLPLNINGYIALPVSILWGFFSLILVNVINVPVIHFVETIPSIFLYFIDVICLILFVLDTVLSTVQALDLKKVLNYNTILLNNIKSIKDSEKIIKEKDLRKAEKVIKRNPGLHSIRHKLNQYEIKNIFTDLKNKK